MKKVSLIHAKANCRCRIAEITGSPALQARLANMGVYKGREVTKVSHIGLRGPVVIKSGRTIMALGHGAAARVLVENE